MKKYIIFIIVLIIIATVVYMTKRKSEDDIDMLPVEQVTTSSSMELAYKYVPDSEEELSNKRVKLLEFIYNQPMASDTYDEYAEDVLKFIEENRDDISDLKGASIERYEEDCNSISEYFKVLTELDTFFLEGESVDNTYEANLKVDESSIKFYKTMLNVIKDQIELNVNNGKDALSDLDFLQGYLKIFADVCAEVAYEDGLIDSEKVYDRMNDEDIKNRFDNMLFDENLRGPLHLGNVMFKYWRGEFVLSEDSTYNQVIKDDVVTDSAVDKME